MDLINIFRKLDNVCHQIYHVLMEVYVIISIERAIIQCI